MLEKLAYILGDYNITLLNYNQHSKTKHFLDEMISLGFLPMIDKPTRLANDSFTLIDNIFTNNHCLKLYRGLWTVDISDHLPIFLILPGSEKTKKGYVIEKNRHYTQEGYEKFKLALQNHDWSSSGVFTESDIHSKMTIFSDVLSLAHDQYFPLQAKKVRTVSSEKPWITAALKKSIQLKNNLYKKYVNTRNPLILDNYKRYKNKLVTILRAAEKNHYANKLKNAANDLSKTWKILNKIIERNLDKQEQIVLTDSNGIILIKKATAQKFNHYFTHIGQELSMKFQNNTIDPKSLLKGSYPDTMFLSPTNKYEIIKTIQGLKNSYSSGIDNISTVLLKKCSTEISEPLQYIFNCSFEQGEVPTCLKIARVVPVYKSGDKTKVSNYRPISILPALSKVIEKLVHSRLLNFLNKSNVLHPNQFGFRNKLSTQMALIELVDKISSSIDDGNSTVGVF